MNVADMIRDSARRHAAKSAIVFQGRQVTYAELDDRVDITAAALASLGVRPGDRVALVAGNVPEFATTLYGVLRAGGVACPLNPALTAEELGYILADAGAAVVVTELASLSAVLSVRDRLADLRAVVVIGGPPAPPGTVSLEEALGIEAEPPLVEVGPDDLAVIAYTAGTTAEPKGAMLTHGNLMANLEQMNEVPNLAQVPDDVVLLALPIFHIYGLSVALCMSLRAGATIVLVERFDPADSMGLVQQYGVTLLLGAPQMFAAWLALAERGGPAPDLSKVRKAVSGAAPLPPETLRAFEERFGVVIWEGYGLTEAGPAVTTNAVGGEAKPGSIGLPLPGVEVKLVDESGEEIAEDDDPGEILVRGPNVFGGYWNRPEESAEVLEGGWLRTGDVAFRDEDGYLFIVDRKKDLIIVSGFNVFPREVEEALERHPRVREAAVVGVPDERTGEGIQAWVVPEPGQSVTPEEVLDFLQDHLARFKQPKEVRVVQELPHHITGKVLRRALREEPGPGESGDQEPEE